MEPIPYGKQNITEEDIEAVILALKSEFLTQGPKVAEFERNFSNYIGVKYAVAVSNGTAALHLAALGLGVNSKTNVITTPITFAATANCVRFCGGQVFFADIDKDTYLLDPNKVEDLIKSKPANYFQGIIPVDFAGLAVNLEDFKFLAEKYNLWIIEDACHAPGGYFKDSSGNVQRCGNGIYSDVAVFSFHPVKHIACGEGGMITTNNFEIYQKMLLLRTHGITRDPMTMMANHGGWYYEMQELGYNYRLTDFQAALGISQLNRASEGLEHRKEIARKYSKAFGNRSYIINHSEFKVGHAYHLYIIQVEKRKELYDYLRTNEIFCQVHYIPVHTLPYYRALGSETGNFPIAEKYYEQCLSLPMYPTLTSNQQNRIIKAIEKFYD